jgi:hypothetical protein
MNWSDIDLQYVADSSPSYVMRVLDQAKAQQEIDLRLMRAVVQAGNVQEPTKAIQIWRKG